MCERCRKTYQDAVADAMDHCDAEGIPEDSIMRGLVQVQMLCSMHPDLAEAMKQMWPNATALCQ